MMCFPGLGPWQASAVPAKRSALGHSTRQKEVRFFPGRSPSVKQQCKHNFALVFSFLFCFFLAGCLEDSLHPGEIARINGRSITLGQLEAMQESSNTHWGLKPFLSLEELRLAYGPALSELLAVELVKEQLDKKNMAVTAEELAAEEALIRADYPGNSFEEMLVNEAVDLDHWRFLLMNTLSVRKYQQLVLRPNITISSGEIEQYYNTHTEDFHIPAKSYFILLSAKDEAVMDRGRKALLQTADPVRVQAENPELTVDSVRMAADRLPPEVGALLETMTPGQLSPSIVVDGSYRSVLVLEMTPERKLSPGEAYPLIEEVLMGEKLEAAYNAWLRSRFLKSAIRIAPQLLPAGEQPAPAPASAGAAAPSNPEEERRDSAGAS